VTAAAPRTVAVVTGSRAEFGLLEPVMNAIAAEPSLRLRTIVAGAHLLPPAETWRDIETAGIEIAARIPMQRAGEGGRLTDARSAGRGMDGFAGTFAGLRPHWVVVLGDRIEPFAAAAAASIAGIAVAHVHGGDRAEGIADEALRHAITKLAHLHLAATEASAQRIVRLGEAEAFVHNVGSPAIDGLDRIEPMSDDDARPLGDPAAVFLMHPSGLDEKRERDLVRQGLAALEQAMPGRNVACFEPNHDAGREPILEEIRAATARRSWPVIDHMPRRRFLALLKRLARRPDGLMVGNSSAGLIEAAAIRLPAFNIGPRQAGRERPNNVFDAPSGDEREVRAAIERAMAIDRTRITHPYGDGCAGPRLAALLARTDPRDPRLLRKRCAY